MSVIDTIAKGIGNTFIKVNQRILKIWHDDAGYIDVNGKRFFVLSGVITSGVTNVPALAVAGSIGFTIDTTGKNQVFRSDGTHWLLMLAAVSSYAGRVYLGAVPAATTTGAITQLSLNGIADGGVASGIVQPKTPRNVKLTITDANSSISAYSITVAGKAPDGTAITETFTFADGLTPTGSKIFQKITSVTVNSIVGDGASDTLDMGYGAKLGVPVPYGAQSLVIQTLQADGTIEAASATDQTNNSFTPSTAPNGTHVYDVAFSYAPPA